MTASTVQEAEIDMYLVVFKHIPFKKHICRHNHMRICLEVLYYERMRRHNHLHSKVYDNNSKV